METAKKYTYTTLAAELGVTTNELKDKLGVGRPTNNTLELSDEAVERARQAFPAEEERLDEAAALEEAFTDTEDDGDVAEDDADAAEDDADAAEDDGDAAEDDGDVAEDDADAAEDDGDAAKTDSD